MKATAYIVLTAAVFLFATQACDNEQFNEMVEFGAEYQVISESSNPYFRDNKAYIKLAYSGCELNQDFELKGRINEDSQPELWLYKITPDQDCEAYFQREFSFEVPRHLIDGNAVLLTPDGKRLGFLVYGLRD